MRDAFIITIVLIIIFTMLGFAYNLLLPNLARLGVIDKPGSTIAARADGGIFRSDDFRRSWIHSSKVEGDDGLEKSDVYDIKFFSQNFNTLYAVTSHGLFVSTTSGDIWQRMPLESAASQNEAVLALSIDEKNPERMYAATFLEKSRSRILKMRAEGFYEVYSTVGPDIKIVGLWVDSRDSNTIFAGTSSGLLLESRDFGESWRAQNEFFGYIHDLEMSPADSRIMYLAVDGKIFKTTDQGKKWSDITPPTWKNLDKNFTVNDITMNLHDSFSIYVATSNGLFRSGNLGASFALIELPSENKTPKVATVHLSNTTKDLLYIGVESQIYKSNDAGNSWQNRQLDTARKVNVIRVKPDDPQVIFVGVSASE